MNTTIIGNVKRFLSINTTEYNNDGEYVIRDLDRTELVNFGWDNYDDEEYPTYTGSKMMKIDDMGVGTIICANEKGAYLMRIA